MRLRKTFGRSLRSLTVRSRNAATRSLGVIASSSSIEMNGGWFAIAPTVPSGGDNWRIENHLMVTVTGPVSQRIHGELHACTWLHGTARLGMAGYAGSSRPSRDVGCSVVEVVVDVIEVCRVWGDRDSQDALVNSVDTR